MRFFTRINVAGSLIYVSNSDSKVRLYRVLFCGVVCWRLSVALPVGCVAVLSGLGSEFINYVSGSSGL